MEKQIIERALSVIEELQIKLIIAFLLLMIPNGLFFFEYRSVCEIEF